jgi:hypothetical protein
MDEDFFLYYEEVALCARARAAGWPVAFDPALGVVHSRPLQSRALSPSLRLIVRHSQMLYYAKFRPAWEFRALTAIVRLEALAALMGRRLAGREVDAMGRSHQAVLRLARRMRRGERPRGAEVRDQALALCRPGTGLRGPVRPDRALSRGPTTGPHQTPERSAETCGSRMD